MLWVEDDKSLRDLMPVEELVWTESDQILTEVNRRRYLGKEHVLGDDKYDLICCSDLQEAIGKALKYMWI